MTKIIPALPPAFVHPELEEHGILVFLLDYGDLEYVDGLSALVDGRRVISLGHG